MIHLYDHSTITQIRLVQAHIEEASRVVQSTWSYRVSSHLDFTFNIARTAEWTAPVQRAPPPRLDGQGPQHIVCPLK